MYMQVIKSFKAGIENSSFSILTKSNAIFSIFSRINFAVLFDITNLSSPWK